MYAFCKGKYQDLQVDYIDGDSYNLALENLDFWFVHPRVGRECTLTKRFENGRWCTLDRRRFSIRGTK